jgi:hypothetical protein
MEIQSILKLSGRFLDQDGSNIIFGVILDNPLGRKNVLD